MAKEETRGETKRHEALIKTRAPDHTATTGRTLGTYDQGWRHAPYLLKAGLPACYLVEVNSRKNA